MAVKFFGQFLVEKGLVTREQVLAAIELQEKKNLKLGEIVVALGFAAPGDVERAHRSQLSKDMRLGDLLVELGVLTQPQLQEALTRQKNQHIYIGEALVLVGALTSASVQQHLAAFKADQAEYAVDKIELPAPVNNAAVWEMAIDLTHKMLTRVLDLKFRPGRSSVIEETDKAFVMAAMDLSGDVAARYIVSTSEKLQKHIARPILKQEDVDREPTEVLEDTVREFVNIVVGNIAAKASQMGKIMNINPPVTLRPQRHGIPVPPGQTGFCFPVHLDDGELMQVILFIKG